MPMPTYANSMYGYVRPGVLWAKHDELRAWNAGQGISTPPQLVRTSVKAQNLQKQHLLLF